ncbi:MAG: hypothetical protein QW812_03110 [Thermoplasmataceae archaeon]
MATIDCSINTSIPDGRSRKYSFVMALVAIMFIATAVLKRKKIAHRIEHNVVRPDHTDLGTIKTATKQEKIKPNRL